MKINDLKEGMRGVNIEAAIKTLSDIKEFTNFGKTGRLAKAVIKDETGSINLNLWNEQIDNVKTGQDIRIINGHVKSYKGELQLNVGRFGSINHL